MRKLGLFVLLLVLVSCKNITHEDYVLDMKNDTKLPSLESVVNISNLESVFSSGGVIMSANNVGTKLGNNGWVETGAASSTTFKDVRVQDALTLFDDFVKNKITDPYGKKQGYIVFSIGYRNPIRCYKSIPFSLISIFTLGTVNTLGFPAEQQEEEMKLIVEILDQNKNLIKRYDSEQTHSEWVAAYWGYGNNISKKISIENIKQALISIGKQIDLDSKEIKKKLKHL